MASIHGVLVCAGNAERFAESVGKGSPYPKHLEMIGDRSVLGRAVDGLVRNVHVSGITITVNPVLKDMYVTHLQMLQQDYPDIPLSFVESDVANQGLFNSLRSDIRRQVCDLRGHAIEFGDPILAVGYGDAIIEGGDGVKLHQDVQARLSELAMGSGMAFVIGMGMAYYLARLDYLDDSRYPLDTRKASSYDLRGWNINTVEDLLKAKRDLGYSLTEGKMEIFTSHPRKESI